MTYLSLFEKLKVFFDLILDYKIVLALVILLISLTILYLIKKISKKKYIIGILISFILVFSISILSNYKILSNTFDNFTTIFFRGIYFPSIYLYISILVLSLIVFIVSILNKKSLNIYKIVNTIWFIINNIFLVIILNIVAKGKIDIFSTNSLYTNTNLVVMLELNMSITILWILTLITIYLTNIINDRITSKKVVEATDTIIDTEITPSIIDNNTKEEVPSIIDNSIKEEVPSIIVDTPNIPSEVINTYSIEDTTKKEDNTSNNNSTINDLLNNVEAVYYNNDIPDIEYTITDPQKQYEDMNTNTTNIDTNNNIAFQDILEEEPQVITIKKEDIPKENIIENNIDSSDTTNSSKDTYSIEDYKKMIQMLNDIKNLTNSSNISKEDAINITLISRYSIDDCLKFKDLLESNLV